MVLRRTLERAALKLRWEAVRLAAVPEYLRERKLLREAAAAGGEVTRIDRPLGNRERHVFDIAGTGDAQRMLTTFEMHLRERTLCPLLPERLTSVLDIGCCRGWLTLLAARRPECEWAVGIDVLPEFIQEARRAASVLDLHNTRFEYAFLDDIANDPEGYQTPFQTILLINTYHYMYWGSSYSERHWPDHDYLLRTLTELCTDRMLFMTPLEVSGCPGDIRKRAAAHPDWAAAYTAEGFFAAAERYFDVTPRGHLGARPLYLMQKR